MKCFFPLLESIHSPLPEFFSVFFFCVCVRRKVRILVHRLVFWNDGRKRGRGKKNQKKNSVLVLEQPPSFPFKLYPVFG